VGDSPTTPRICRIALVTGDNLLSSAVIERTTAATNIRIVNSIDELKSLINTLVSTVSEEVVARIKEQASAYFFVLKKEDTLFYTEKIIQKIGEKFKKELHEMPEGADRRENGSWHISPPRFVKKEGQRVTWVSPIEVEAKAFKREGQSGFWALTEPLGPLSDVKPALFSFPAGSVPTAIPLTARDVHTYWESKPMPPGRDIISSGIFLGGPEKMIAQGRTYFEITWSHLLSTNQKFRSPRIDQINFIKTAWEEKQ
jgi:hypothetical protein